MVAAGMTPVQAIVAATRTSAEILRLDKLGTIASGKSADFIVLDANPLDEITNTRRIADVYLRGRHVDRKPSVEIGLVDSSLTMLSSSSFRHGENGTTLAHESPGGQRPMLRPSQAREKTMAEKSLEERVDMLERRVEILEQLPERLTALEVQIVELRDEMRAEFSATRVEGREGDEHVMGTLREEIRAGDERVVQTRRQETAVCW